MPEALPILWSFRRCPYAMRARLAVQASGVKVQVREVVLRDKPAPFLAISPDATVPCLDLGDHAIPESFDIMLWALAQCDPGGWLDMPDGGRDLVRRFDGPFKRALDHTKYHTRYRDCDPEAERAAAMAMLAELENRLTPYLFGTCPKLADMAILPFVRQFAMIDKVRFDAKAGPNVSAWLTRFLESDLFAAVMLKLVAWTPDGDCVEMPFVSQAPPAR